VKQESAKMGKNGSETKLQYGGPMSPITLLLTWLQSAAVLTGSPSMEKMRRRKSRGASKWSRMRRSAGVGCGHASSMRFRHTYAAKMWRCLFTGSKNPPPL